MFIITTCSMMISIVLFSLSVWIYECKSYIAAYILFTCLIFLTFSHLYNCYSVTIYFHLFIDYKYILFYLDKNTFIFRDETILSLNVSKENFPLPFLLCMMWIISIVYFGMSAFVRFNISTFSASKISYISF